MRVIRQSCFKGKGERLKVKGEAALLLKLQNPALETIEGSKQRLSLKEGRIYDPRRPRLRSSGMFWRWKFSTNPQRHEKRNETYRLNVHMGDGFARSDRDMIVWLGHASFFIRLAGITFLTDPVFFNLPFIRRLAPLPTAISSFTNIDYILLSHGHRDHMDIRTLKALVRQNPRVKLLAPMGAGVVLSRLGNCQEAGWYQKYDTGPKIECIFLPAKHWHRRQWRDINTMLWGSFLLTSGGRSIYFAGDTALDDHFDDVCALFPEIDLALMPIGAYKPEFMMRRSHMSPTQAIEGFNRLGAKTFVPMHYGTYDLTDEPLGEPVRILRQHRDDLHGKLAILDPGDPLYLRPHKS